MRFQRLKLNGFKSFVDPTDLIIADGLTGVVGPNGCGKSNLLEALRWVMGENRPTAMRGGGMEDVIFAGAATRPAKSFAEVVLTIENLDRTAPAGFNDTDQIEIVRRITRDAGSAYKANSKDVRARDVQMLFADASSGAHSPALVRQGQISELINAKPKARRRILEDAAGIAGLYQRRHEAELKLNGAETNLARVEDVLDALAKQIAALARQARQAERYRAISVELRKAEGVLHYGLWRAAEDERERAVASRTQALGAVSQAERAARDAVATREAAETGLPSLREEDAIAGALHQRLTIELQGLAKEEERATADLINLKDRLSQLGADRDRELTLQSDAQSAIHDLESELAALEAAQKDAADQQAQAKDSAHGAARVLEEREAAYQRLTEDLARISARHQSTQRLIGDAQDMLETQTGAAAGASAAVTLAQTALEAAHAALASAEKQQKGAQATAQEAEAVLVEVEAERAEILNREGQARATRSAADGECSALRSEEAALARLLARESDANGQIIDRLNVAPGFERALGAALEDDLRMGVVTDAGDSGWTDLPAYDETAPLPGGHPMSDYVSGLPLLARRLAQIGLVTVEDGDRLHSALRPGQRLVSAEGDLWRWDGLRRRAEAAPAAAALRLEQLNRLAQLEREAAEAEAKAKGAAMAHDSLKSDVARLTEAEARARAARKAADAALADAARAYGRAEADGRLAEGSLEQAKRDTTRLADEMALAKARLVEAEAARDGLENLQEARAAADAAQSSVDEARTSMVDARSALDALIREAVTRTDRKAAAQESLEGWRARQKAADTRMRDFTDRDVRLREQLEAARGRPEAVAARHRELEEELPAAQTRVQNAQRALSEAEDALKQAVSAERQTERAASDAREARAAADVSAQAAAERAAAAVDVIKERHEKTPDGLLQSLNIDGPLSPPFFNLAMASSRSARSASSVACSSSSALLSSSARRLTAPKASRC
ncbi:MAG: AAA family ATPase, partial [Pseudomonadota bacterium]